MPKTLAKAVAFGGITASIVSGFVLGLLAPEFTAGAFSAVAAGAFAAVAFAGIAVAAVAGLFTSFAGGIYTAVAGAIVATGDAGAGAFTAVAGIFAAVAAMLANNAINEHYARKGE